MAASDAEPTVPVAMGDVAGVKRGVAEGSGGCDGSAVGDQG